MSAFVTVETEVAFHWIITHGGKSQGYVSHLSALMPVTNFS